MRHKKFFLMLIDMMLISVTFTSCISVQQPPSDPVIVSSSVAAIGSSELEKTESSDISSKMSNSSDKESDNPANVTSENGQIRYAYQLDSKTVDFSVKELIENLAPYSSIDEILDYDKNAYYAGKNSYGSQYIVSEHRKLYDIAGVVIYFCTPEGKIGSIYFCSPNISYADYLTLLEHLSTDYDIELKPQVLDGDIEDVSALAKGSIWDIKANYVIGTEEQLILKEESDNYFIRAMLYSINSKNGDVPLAWSVEPQPKYGQGQSIINDMKIEVWYPGEV